MDASKSNGTIVYDVVNRGNVRFAVTGGYVYRGTKIPALIGRYVFEAFPPTGEGGRLIEESVDPAAFGMVQNRARRFLVNMEHDEARIIGNVRNVLAIELMCAAQGLDYRLPLRAGRTRRDAARTGWRRQDAVVGALRLALAR